MAGAARGLGVAGGVEPGVLAVEDEELAGGGVVAPAHEAGLFQEEGAGLGAVEAHAGVVLGVVGAEGVEVVVVVVDAVEEGCVGGLGCKRNGVDKREQQRRCERNTGVLRCAQNDKPKGRSSHLLDWLGAVGAAGGVYLDDVVLVGAVAVVAGLADGLGDCGELVGGVGVLIVDGDLGAAGEGEDVAGLLAGGGELGIEKLGALRGGCAGLGVAAQGGRVQANPADG